MTIEKAQEAEKLLQKLYKAESMLPESGIEKVDVRLILHPNGTTVDQLVPRELVPEILEVLKRHRDEIKSQLENL